MGDRQRFRWTNGASVTSSVSNDLTYMGVSDSNIAERLDGVVLQYINESRVRSAELGRGTLLTDCVSVCISQTGSALSVNVGIKAGHMIWHMLRK